MTDTKAPERVWVTHRETTFGTYIEGASLTAWDDDYDAPITKLAKNTEYAPADLIEAQAAEIERLRRVMQNLHDDMLERSRLKMDVIHGEEYRVVNAGNGAWMDFCNALAASEPPKPKSPWEPIETAPKDGTLIFVWHETTLNRHAAFDTEVKKAQWLVEAGEWRVEGVGGNVPPILTHWMPYPEPPEAI